MTRPRRANVIPRHPSSDARSGALTYAGLDPGTLVRIGPGAQARVTEWERLFGEGRLRTRAYAVARRITNATAAFGYQTAAAAHGLPVYRSRSDRVDLIVPGPHSRKNSLDVVRHRVPLPDTDVLVIDGLRLTTLERTVYDVIRTASLEAAVVCFDAALHRAAWHAKKNTYDTEVAERFRTRVQERIRRHKGARGIRQARFVASFADGRAQSPGESVSRLWMWQLNVPRPELQYRVVFPDGTYALLDFAWPRRSRWGEFDGKIKYADADLLGGRTPDEVLERQARREERARRATGWRCDRWGFDEMPTIDDFCEYLRTIGLYPA